MVTWVVLGGVLLALYVLIYYNLIRCPKCRSSAKLTGKTVIVTGANTGIGKACALDLAKRGARVILACRDKVKAEAAVYDIRKESGNNEVLFMHLDLESLQSVRSFAETFLKSEPRLDVLINNAGVVGGKTSSDGFSIEFRVNHLGHFLLTILLLDRLKQAEAGRVVVVASEAHHWGSIDSRFLSGVATKNTSWSSFRSYCDSKLCNILFTRELANKLEGTNVSCYAVHPGSVFTDLSRNMKFWQKLLFVPLAKLFFQDAENGAQTTIYCTVQEGIEMLSGRYFSQCQVKDVSASGRDDALAKKLWEVSERLVGIA
ncbi:DHR13 reductase, partial [Polypterus senegalus]